MDIWTLLGIEPTTNIAEIKRAYAVQAKQCHPEEHPEEFKRLQAAYRQAISLAKAQRVYTEAEVRDENAPEAGAESRDENVPEVGAESRDENAPEAEAESQDEKAPKAEAESRDENAPEAEAESQGENVPEAEAESQDEKAPEAEAGNRDESVADAGQEHPSFTYDDVTDFCQEETMERFFREFGQIARTPYLQNRKVMWSYFLFQADYEDLYHHDGFRRKFLEEICAIPGWHREILDYFEWWLSLYKTNGGQEIPMTRIGAGKAGDGAPFSKRDRYAGREADLQKETGSRRWRWKKLCSRLPHLLPEYVVSEEQRMRHYLILQNMRDRGLNDRLLTVASVEGYWRYYRDFLKDNEGWLGLQYKISRKKRRGYRAALGTFAVLLYVILVLELGVRPVLLDRQRAALAEQEAAKEAVLLEEQKRLEEDAWKQELEQRFQQLEQQHQDWMNEK